ncbi:MAG: hypothetical protein AB8B79_07620 [Granulosicoccus sp.]
MNAYSNLFGLSALLLITSCGGGGGGGGSSTDSEVDTSSTTALLTTGANDADTATLWNCEGSDGTDPISFSQRLFSDGTGQIEQQGASTSAFTWLVTSENAYSITFPADGIFPEETFSITDLSFSAVNSENDRYDGIDSRDATPLSCTKSQSSITPPAEAPSLEMQITNADNLNDNTNFWECGDTDFIFLGDSSVVVMNNGGDFTRSWEATSANSLLVTGIGGFSWNQIDFSSSSNFTAVDFSTNEVVSCQLLDLADIEPMVATCPASVVDDFNEVESHEFFPDNPQGSPASLIDTVLNDLGGFCQSDDTFTAGGGQVFSAQGVIRSGGGLGPEGSVEGTFIYSFYRNVTGNFVDGSQEREIGNQLVAPFKEIGTFEEAQACSLQLLGCSNF